MKRFLLLLFVLTYSTISHSQILLGLANYKFNNLNYTDAIPLYEYYLKKPKNVNNIIAIRNLAVSYHLTNRSVEAEPLFGQLTTMDSNWNDLVNYAEVLLKNKKYDTAFRFVNKPTILAKNDVRIIKIINSIQNLNELVASDTGNLKIAMLPFNSSQSDFSPAFYKNGIVFSSTRQVSDFVQRNHTWTDKSFTNLFYTSAEDGYEKTEKFAKQLRGKYNYGPATFNRNGNEMYYTINNPKKKSKNGFKNLRIYSAKYNLQKKKWVKTYKFPYNSTDYASTHPSLSIDGKKLYFSSNMPGGYGGMDIYVCTLKDSLWSKPKNLGPNINSPGEELFPFIDKDSLLFFASDGRGGLGGLDIFSFNLKDTSAIAENVGAPLNSYADDFALIKYPTADKGFFSSSRGNEGIDDDIYSYVRIKPKGKTINVFVVDNATGRLIDSSSLVVSSEIYKTPFNYLLPEGRLFQLSVVANKKFKLEASAEGYTNNSISFTANSADSIYVIKLNKLLKGCIVQGTITDKLTGQKLDSATVIITNTLNNTEVYRTLTNDNGFYRFTGLLGNTAYQISVQRKGYFSKEQGLTTYGNTCITTTLKEFDYVKDFPLEPIIIGKAIKIDNIYFDLNKYNIRPDAAVELDKIVKVLTENPDIIIELSSHTDARGSDASNMTLSDNRAKSSASYIISKGIAENRITGKGYGESKLVNRCGNNVKCSEKEHQQNRRTEFQVVGFLSDQK